MNVFKRWDMLKRRMWRAAPAAYTVYLILGSMCAIFLPAGIMGYSLGWGILFAIFTLALYLFTVPETN